MKTLCRIGIVAIIVLVHCVSVATMETDVRAWLVTQDITTLRINLNSRGAELGFETEVNGDDTRVQRLAALISDAEPAKDHRCSNLGVIRFAMADGSVIGVGLLPSHTEGSYELRLYDGDHYLAVYRVERTALLDALEALGVPVDDPAFRE